MKIFYAILYVINLVGSFARALEGDVFWSFMFGFGALLAAIIIITHGEPVSDKD